MSERNFIGSSDIAVLLGLSPFQTPLELWAIKTRNIVEKDLSDNEAVEWGKRLERVVSKKFSDKNKVKLIAYKKRFVHPKYDFLTCELDNIIAGTDEIVEIKTTSLWNYKSWEKPDDVPAQYICQVMWALGISGRKVGYIALLCGGQKYLEKKILFDKELFDKMVAKAVYFWDEFIIKKQMPIQISSKDNDILYQLFPTPNEGSQIQLNDDANKIIENLQGAKADLMQTKDLVSKLENELKMLLKDNEVGLTGKYKISWTPQIFKRLDLDRIKEEVPEIYNKYIKETRTRVLRYKEIKED